MRLLVCRSSNPLLQPSIPAVVPLLRWSARSNGDISVPAPIYLDLVWTAKAAQERTQGTGEVSDLGGGRNAKEEMKLEEEQALRNAAEAGEFG